MVRKEVHMGTYIALHTLTPHMPIEEAARFVYSVLTNAQPGMTWKRYWISDERGIMFCLWEAPNQQLVADVLAKAAIPTDIIYEVEEGDPDLFRQGLGA
jgi:hypothetical protein